MHSDARWHSPAALEHLNMEKLAYSINETARMLSLGRTSIYAMIADGRLVAFKLGRRRLVNVDSIKRLIQQAV